MFNRSTQFVAKANAETAVPISGDYFMIASAVVAVAARSVFLVRIKTDNSDYVPYRQGEGSRETFTGLIVKNDTVNDVTITIIYGSGGNFLSNVAQMENAHTVATSDNLVLDATGGPDCSFLMPGVVINSTGLIMRRKEIQIQNIAEPGGNPLSVRFENSIVPPGFADIIGGIFAMQKLGYVQGLGLVSGGPAAGQIIPVDATGANVRTFQTDANIKLIAKAGAVNTILLTQFWYLLNA